MKCCRDGSIFFAGRGTAGAGAAGRQPGTIPPQMSRVADDEYDEDRNGESVGEQVHGPFATEVGQVFQGGNQGILHVQVAVV